LFRSHPIELVIEDPIETGVYSVDQLHELMNHTRNVIVANQR